MTNRVNYETVLIVLVFVCLGKMVEASFESGGPVPVPILSGGNGVEGYQNGGSHGGWGPGQSSWDGNKCSKMKCKYGCYNGQCLSKWCNSDSQCSKTQTCNYNACEQACSWLTCPAGGQCVHGVCYPPKCTDDRFCSLSEVCQNGFCKEKCRDLVCGPGYICIQGKCYGEPNECVEQDQSDVKDHKKRGGPKCKSNQKCVNGKCVPKCKKPPCQDDKVCQNVVCPLGFICRAGTCVPSINYCTDDTDIVLTPCTDPRPTPANCFLPPFAPPGPPPAYCGITASGERRNFLPVECLVCQSQDILYYFNKPCYSAPFICSNSEECLGYYCSSSCSVTDECPYNWQICSGGKCLDQCITMRCPDCKFGQCNYSTRQLGSCIPFNEDQSCDLTKYRCWGTGCVDVCEREACPPFQNCQPSGTCSA